MRLHGLGERAVEVEPNRRYELGPFTVTFVPSLHSKLLLGFAVPFDGELTCEHAPEGCPTRPNVLRRFLSLWDRAHHIGQAAH
jgi:hypothetical protein